VPQKAPTIYKSTSNEAELLSLRSKTSESVGTTPHLDESLGFLLDTDHLDYERSTKSSRNDDGFSRNPKQLLSSLIDCRQDLKTEIESMNGKMSKIDKKITEILHLMSLGDIQSKSNTNLSVKTNKRSGNLLDIHTQPIGTLNDSSYSFGLNSNLNLSQFTRNIHNSPTAHIETSSKRLPISQEKEKQPTQIVIPASSTSSKMKQSSSNLNEKLAADTKVSSKMGTAIQFNEKQASLSGAIKPGVVINPPVSNQSKISHKSSSHGSRLPAPLGLKKSDLAASNASTVASAVVGATSILSNTNMRIPFSSSSSNQPTTTSNYNVNLIPCETERKYLTSSASENLIKETPYRKLVEKRHKEKLLYDEDIEDSIKF
jgi:hypothetical protein